MPSWWNSTQSSSLSLRRTTLVLAQQVRQLLLRQTSTNKSLVEIRDHSQIAVGAGRGVWSTTHIPKQSALCLYPGVYTPGLPLYTVTTNAADNNANVVYLGKSTPPSSYSSSSRRRRRRIGGDFDENAYILNVQLPTGGYLDGLALEYTSSTTIDNNDETTKILHCRLDENPNACGHCINHSSTRANAEVISIDWTDIMLGQVLVQNDKSSPASSISSKEDNDEQCYYYYPIPNIVRADKSPWYCVIGEKHGDNNNNNDIDIDHDGIVRFTGQGKCCGAVFCATRDINPEEEILFDYALFPPLPSWAKDWYDQSQ